MHAKPNVSVSRSWKLVFNKGKQLLETSIQIACECGMWKRIRTCKFVANRICIIIMHAK